MDSLHRFVPVPGPRHSRQQVYLLSGLPLLCLVRITAIALPVGDLRGAEEKSQQTMDGGSAVWRAVRCAALTKPCLSTRNVCLGRFRLYVVPRLQICLGARAFANDAVFHALVGCAVSFDPWFPHGPFLQIGAVRAKRTPLGFP